MLYFQEGNFTAPSDWNYSLGLLNPNFRYPWNLTVVIGVNNTIEWTNHDRLAHTVTALTVPQGATLFDSGLISPGQNFIVTLSVPGLYKFDCAWHPWLAGVITVKSS
jgi:plastocyanin